MTKKLLLRKINSIAAFTLAEALVAILILLMVTSVVAAGIPAARRAYENVVTASNAELVLSTTISALRNELGMATDITIETDKTTILYYSQTNASLSKICLYDDASNEYPQGTIMYQVNAGVSGREEFGLPDMKGSSMIPLVSRKSSDENLYSTYDEVRFNADNSVLTFKNLSVKNTDGQVLSPQGRTEESGNVYTSIRLAGNNEND